MALKIAVDDGHEYNTPGKRTPKFSDGSYMNEWDFNSVVKKYLIKELKRAGFEIVDVNPDKKKTSLYQRVSKANNAGADFYISIHANAFTGKWGSGAKGIETYIWSSKNGKSEKIGRIIHKYLMKGTRMTDRGVKDGKWLYVIKNTKMPSVLVECGFMDNKREAKLLKSDSYRRECAIEIAKGICEGFGVDYKPAPSNSTNSDEEKVLDKVEVKVAHLWTYNSDDWDDKYKTYKKGTTFNVKGGKIKVGGGYMYKLTSGKYVTANSKYIKPIYKTVKKEKPESKNDDGKLYRVQVGAYSNKKNAKEMKKKLENAGFSTYINYQ